MDEKRTWYVKYALEERKGSHRLGAYCVRKMILKRMRLYEFDVLVTLVWQI